MRKSRTPYSLRRKVGHSGTVASGTEPLLSYEMEMLGSGKPDMKMALQQYEQMKGEGIGDITSRAFVSMRNKRRATARARGIGSKDLLPQEWAHWGLHNFTGKNTSLETRLMDVKNGDYRPRPDSKPINCVDRASMIHDIDYYKAFKLPIGSERRKKAIRRADEVAVKAYKACPKDTNGRMAGIMGLNGKMGLEKLTPRMMKMIQGEAYQGGNMPPRLGKSGEVRVPHPSYELKKKLIRKMKGKGHCGKSNCKCPMGSGLKPPGDTGGGALKLAGNRGKLRKTKGMKGGALIPFRGGMMYGSGLTDMVMGMVPHIKAVLKTGKLPMDKIKAEIKPIVSKIKKINKSSLMKLAKHAGNVLLPRLLKAGLKGRGYAMRKSFSGGSVKAFKNKLVDGMFKMLVTGIKHLMKNKGYISDSSIYGNGMKGGSIFSSIGKIFTGKAGIGDVVRTLALPMTAPFEGALAGAELLKKTTGLKASDALNIIQKPLGMIAPQANLPTEIIKSGLKLTGNGLRV